MMVGEVQLAVEVVVEAGWGEVGGRCTWMANGSFGSGARVALLSARHATFS